MNNKGLTLVEIMLSVLIILIMSAGILAAFVGGRQLMNRSGHRLQVLNFAKEALDKLRSNHPYNSSNMSIGNHSDVPEICDEIIRGEMAGLNTALTYAVTYPVINNETVTDAYKEVTVHVTWDETGF